MSVTAAALRDLHRLHRQLGDIRSRLQRGPRQARAADEQIARLEQQLQQAKETVLRSRVTADDKELQLREREGHIADVKARLNSCNSNREYQAFLEQIAADEQANSVLSDEILELLDKITEQQQAVQESEKQLVRGREELEAIHQRVDGERSSLETDLNRLTEELTQAEAALPPDFRTEYARVIKARGEEALAPLDGECCGGCYQTVTPQMLNELLQDRPVTCKSCGCLIYRPEGWKSPTPDR
jgi:predicted  nucleic acid-binding Zn-ribbon protein